MKSVYLHRLVTAAALALAAIQMSDASSIRRDTAPLTAIRPWTGPCSPNFHPNPANPGLKYDCAQRFVARCKKDYYVGTPLLVKQGTYWVVHYGCAHESIVPK